jgi:tetratricopeptide (TPR) repeat protein
MVVIESGRSKKNNSALFAMNYFCWLLAAVLTISGAYAQNGASEKPNMLLLDMNMQIEATEAVNNMYNFKFARAEQQFTWIKQMHPTHPLPYFLLGLSEWWKIVPNIDVETYDGRFMAYMDTAIVLADKMYQANDKNIEAAFFLAAGHAFQARLYSERSQWRKATISGKNALKYLDKSRGFEDLSPEFLFGDALYNYYAEWIPKNYPILKPILIFFPKGNMELGAKQLREVANNAFYTRTEAQYFLMRIYSDENQNDKAYYLSKYLNETFPDNAYFERYYARMAFMEGRINEAEMVSLNILRKLDNQMPGYEATSGRYASYYLGYIYHFIQRDTEKAKQYYKRAVNFAEEAKAYDSGYYWSSLVSLARMYDKENNFTESENYYSQILERAEKKSEAYKEAKEYMKKKNQKAREQSSRRS